MKLLKLGIWIFIAVTMTLISCKASKTVQNQNTLFTVPDGKWVLQSMNGKAANALFPNKLPTLEFDKEKEMIYGTGGCNRYSGAFIVNENLFSAPRLATTMMACLGVDHESEFLRTFEKPSSLTLKNNLLTISQDGKEIMVFEKAQPASEKDLSGTWVLQSLQGSTANVYFKDNVPTLTFDFKTNRITGNGGCNTYNGPFTLFDGKLEIGMMVSTRKACIGNMEGEAKYFKELPGTSDIEVENGMLVLKRDGVHVASFIKQ